MRVVKLRHLEGGYQGEEDFNLDMNSGSLIVEAETDLPGQRQQTLAPAGRRGRTLFTREFSTTKVLCTSVTVKQKGRRHQQRQIVGVALQAAKVRVIQRKRGERDA